MSQHLQRQIEVLKEKILSVGALVERAIARAITAIMKRDPELAQDVIDADDEIDHMEVDVEEECLKTLALYQPVAADLRFVVAILKINNDLERMGDLAANIAKRVIYLARHDPVEIPTDMRELAARSQSMVSRSLDALVSQDVNLAQEVRADDDEVDALRRSINSLLKARMLDSPDQTETLMKLHSVTKHLERLGDMATNIAEDVIYMVEGSIVRHLHDD
ncbi:MAG: phosphate signaling complex protein PhoU [Pirellulales bacterium]|nr:phosphate signaling complex protein PhoU [Pirellulales bacterium]